ncbi:MAG: hypothetical protein AAFN10_23750 [Bacteroidota bacterium]
MQEGYFHALKAAVEQRFRQSYPHCPPIQEWKGQDIVLFQEDLAEQVQGRLSEKWFYTHIKQSQGEKLPRIDLLNMLSKYAGFSNWEAFKQSQSVPQREKRIAASHTRLRWKWWPMLAGGIGLLGILMAFMWPTKKPSLCFADADGGTLLYPTQIKVSVWQANKQLVVPLEVDSIACVKIPRKYRNQSLIIQAPYYHADTLEAIQSEWLEGEKILLKKDDYALMIHYFSTAKLEDWAKRREQLDQIFADNARIFQVLPKGKVGMEMFNKEEFINKLITPINSLRNLEVIETVYQGEKNVGLRFQQKP